MIFWSSVSASVGFSMWTRSACPGTSSVTRKYLSSASLGKKSRTPTMLGCPGIELSARYAFEMRSFCFSRSSGGLYGIGLVRADERASPSARRRR